MSIKPEIRSIPQVQPEPRLSTCCGEPLYDGTCSDCKEESDAVEYIEVDVQEVADTFCMLRTIQRKRNPNAKMKFNIQADGETVYDGWISKPGKSSVISFPVGHKDNSQILNVYIGDYLDTPEKVLEDLTECVTHAYL